MTRKRIIYAVVAAIAAGLAALGFVDPEILQPIIDLFADGWD